MSRKGRFSPRFLGLYYGFIVGGLLGAETVFRTALPFPASDSLVTLALCTAVYAIPFALIGLVVSFLPWFRTVGAQISLFPSITFFLFAVFFVNEKMASVATHQKSIIADVALLGAAVFFFFALNDSLPRRARRIWGVIPAVALVAVLIACAWSTPPLPAPTGEIPEPRSPQKVFLCGIDGIDWRILDPLVREGKAPNFVRLMNEGFSSYLRSLVPCESLPVWMTAATGKPPSMHHITDLTVRAVPFLPIENIRFPFWSGLAQLARLYPERPLLRTDLRTNTVFGIAAKCGIRCGGVGWPGSHPAAPVEPFQVTDRFRATDHFPSPVASRRPSAEERFTESENAVWPPEIEQALTDLFLPPGAADASVIEALTVGGLSGESAHEAAERFATIDYWHSPDEDPEAFLRRAFLLPWIDDTSRHAQALYLKERFDPTLFTLSLDGLDRVEHYLWHAMEPDSFPDHSIAPETIERYGEVITGYYLFVDSLVGSLMESLDDETVLIVLSGFGHRPSRDLPRSGSHSFDPALPGVFFARGPGIAAGSTVPIVSIEDLAPTVLALLGLPAGEEMPGRVVTEICGEGGRKTLPRVDSWDHLFRGWEDAPLSDGTGR